MLAAAVLLTVAVLGARGRLRRNPWAGVRTRRTLESDDAFALANRVAAAPLGAAGVVALLGGVALVVGGPGAVLWTCSRWRRRGCWGSPGSAARSASGRRRGSRFTESGCAGTCAGCDLVAGCRPAATDAAPDRAAGPA